jgi:hypothetical protein
MKQFAPAFKAEGYLIAATPGLIEIRRFPVTNIIPNRNVPLGQTVIGIVAGSPVAGRSTRNTCQGCSRGSLTKVRAGAPAVEPKTGFEPVTYGLRNRCSTN